MALTDESNGNGMVMPVAPMMGGNGGFGNGFGGDWAWIILLLLLGWGNNGWGNGGFGGGSDIYPWMNQADLTNSGFRDQMINNNITSIRDGISGLSTQICGGFGDVQNSLCNGFAGVNSSIANGFAQSEIAANGRQMANMNQAFAAQTAMAQGFNQLGSQFADCLKKIIEKAKDNLVFTKYTVGSCAA